MKKSILYSILAVIMCLSCFVMFACNKDDKDTLTTYKDFITIIQSENTMFKSDNINGIKSDYYLNDFYSKNYQNVKIEDDVNYLVLCAGGLNFIENYYTKIEKGKAGKLKSGIIDMSESFTDLLNNYRKFKNVTDYADYEIYNGFFARYKWQAKDFINVVYENALDLADYIYNDLGFGQNVGQIEDKDKGIVGEKEGEFLFYFDYQNLLILNDYRLFFMDSCLGQQMDNDLYKSISENFKVFVNIVGSTIKDVDKEYKEDYILHNSLLNSEREMTKNSIEKFSLYDFVNEYNSNIDAYEKKESNATAYYLQIERYHTSYLIKYRTFVSDYIAQ